MTLMTYTPSGHMTGNARIAAYNAAIPEIAKHNYRHLNRMCGKNPQFASQTASQRQEICRWMKKASVATADGDVIGAATAYSYADDMIVALVAGAAI